MSQNCNKLKIQGRVEFSEYDKQQNLVNQSVVYNTVSDSGFISYSSILTQMLDSQNPKSIQLDDEYPKSILQNSVFLGGANGQLTNINTLQVIEKCQSKYDKSFLSDDYYNSNNDYAKKYFNSVTNDSLVINKNSFLQNSDLLITQFLNPFMNTTITQSVHQYLSYSKLYVVYKIESQQQFHTGIKINLKGLENKKNFFKIAYDFDGYTTDVPRSEQEIMCFSERNVVFPLINGKPTYYSPDSSSYVKYKYYGLQPMDYNMYSYFFDMYPRCCRIPKAIIFIIQSGVIYHDSYFVQQNKIQVESIQFLTHRKKKTGPICLWFKNSNDEYIMKRITKTKILSDGTLGYYAKLDYNDVFLDGNSSIVSVGLSNSLDNIVYKSDTAMNACYQRKNNYNIVKNSSTTCSNSTTSFDYFYKFDYADLNECNQYLTQAKLQTPIIKSNDKRIDFLYKIDFGFNTINSDNTIEGENE